VTIEGQRIYLKLSENDCNTFFEKWYLNDEEFVSQEESIEWVNKSIAGNITKKNLDDERI